MCASCSIMMWLCYCLRPHAADLDGELTLSCISTGIFPLRHRHDATQKTWTLHLVERITNVSIPPAISSTQTLMYIYSFIVAHFPEPATRPCPFEQARSAQAGTSLFYTWAPVNSLPFHLAQGWPWWRGPPHACDSQSLPTRSYTCENDHSPRAGAAPPYPPLRARQQLHQQHDQQQHQQHS